MRLLKRLVATALKISVNDFNASVIQRFLILNSEKILKKLGKKLSRLDLTDLTYLLKSTKNMLTFNRRLRIIAILLRDSLRALYASVGAYLSDQ